MQIIKSLNLLWNKLFYLQVSQLNIFKLLLCSLRCSRFRITVRQRYDKQNVHSCEYLQWHQTKCDLFHEEFLILLKIPRITRDMNYLPQAK